MRRVFPDTSHASTDVDSGVRQDSYEPLCERLVAATARVACLVGVASHSSLSPAVSWLVAQAMLPAEWN